MVAYSYLYTGEDVEERCLSIEDLHALLLFLKGAAAKWRFIGLALKFLDPDLDIIERKPISAVEGPLRCFSDMLSQWLKRERPKLKDLAEALRDPLVEQEGLASRLEEEFKISCKTQTFSFCIYSEVNISLFLQSIKFICPLALL